MISHAKAAVDALRREVESHVVMMLVDAKRHLDGDLGCDEIHDFYINIYQPYLDVAPVATPVRHGRPRSFGGQFWRDGSYRWAIWRNRHRTRISRTMHRLWNSDHRHLAGTFLGMSILAVLPVLGAKILLRLGLVQDFKNFVQWRRAIRRVERYLSVLRPDAIVVAEDNIQTFTRIFTAGGRRLGIPSIVLPYTIPNPKEAAQYYFDDRSYRADRIAARFFVRFFPKWRYEHNGRALIRLPVHKALAIESFGYSTPAPWILNRGSSAAIALDSETMRETYLNLGFPPEQLSVTGSPQSELLHQVMQQKEQHRQQVCKEYDFEAGRPLVVCAFPPDQYSGSSISGFEFPTFDALVAAWMQALGSISDRANVLVRPHPRLDATLLARYERPGLKVSTLPTARLVPLSDLYVACISATIGWAVSCGIPVINYDTYRFRYGDFDAAAGVLPVEHGDAFRALLERFIADPAFAADVTAKQRSVMGRWGLVDGKFGERFSALAQATIEDWQSRADGSVARPRQRTTSVAQEHAVTDPKAP